jgi:hypothetical protein
MLNYAQHELRKNVNTKKYKKKGYFLYEMKSTF